MSGARLAMPSPVGFAAAIGRGCQIMLNRHFHMGMCVGGGVHICRNVAGQAEAENDQRDGEAAQQDPPSAVSLAPSEPSNRGHRSQPFAGREFDCRHKGRLDADQPRRVGAGSASVSGRLASNRCLGGGRTTCPQKRPCNATCRFSHLSGCAMRASFGASFWCQRWYNMVPALIRPAHKRRERAANGRKRQRRCLRTDPYSPWGRLPRRRTGSLSPP